VAWLWSGFEDLKCEIKITICYELTVEDTDICVSDVLMSLYKGGKE
jgi:hypothetical protein